MKIQRLKSSKLFFNKWLFRIECIQPGASRIRRNIHTSGGWWADRITFYDSYRLGVAGDQQDQLKKFSDAVQQFLFSDEIQIRSEGSHFNLFCKDPAILAEIEKNLQPWIHRISGPTTQEEHDFLLSNGSKKTICDHLPKNQFQYRVFFSANWDIENRANFLRWAQRVNGLVEISKENQRWLSGKRHYCQNSYVYVKDSKTLTMVSLQAGEQIRKVEEFVLRNSILKT